jgi:DNA-binding transcriptional LysR family regulator
MMTRPPPVQRSEADIDAGAVDLRRLRYFVVVAEELHFTRAARRLGITQSSLSAAIQRLESERGVQLLRRSTRRVALTPDGAWLLEEARALLRAVERFTSRAAGVHSLRVGSCPPARAALVDPIVDDCVRAGFDEVVALREELSGALLRGVDEGALDVAIVVGAEAEAPGRVVEPLTTVPLVVGVSPLDPLARRRRLRLEELAGRALYVLSDEDAAGSRSVAVQACRDAGFEPELWQAPFAFTSPPLIAGRTFTLMADAPGWAWGSQLALIPLEEPAPAITFDLVRRERASAPVDAFVSAARRVAAREGWPARS